MRFLPLRLDSEGGRSKNEYLFLEKESPFLCTLLRNVAFFDGRNFEK